MFHHIRPVSRVVVLCNKSRCNATTTLNHNSSSRFLSSVAATTKPPEGVDVANPIAERREVMSKFNRYMVWGITDEHIPAPILPDDPKEIATLDPVDQGHRHLMDGTTRTVIIRQEKKSMRQAPLNPESIWKIFFYEDGMTSEKWTNSLMGWTSNADPYQLDPPLTFSNAAEAVYFAKKRGWNYVVKAPIKRYMRRDDAQYQDNFLPIATANLVQREGKSCAYWSRTSSGNSHYFRPLKYHGDGTVRQHGPNQNAKIVPHVEGVYKMR